MTHRNQFPTASRRLLAALTLCAGGTAQAIVGAPGVSDAGGALADIPYGGSGNVFQLQPMVFIAGLGAPDDPLSVVTLNSALSFAHGVSGAGSSLLQVHYTIDNLSPVQSFSDLRFMVFLNPDGEPAQFLDQAGEGWGAALPGEPAAREWQAFSLDPLDSILARFRVNATLADGAPTGDCAGAAGCDLTAALQWNSPQLGPMQRLTVTLGLSDDGQSLSSRWISATGVGSSDTVLTVSGLAAVTAVPDAPRWATLLAGLSLLGAWLRRQRGVVSATPG
jgi:hypothetical protein